MIGKVVRGNDVGGLLRYLYGPGRANEHTNPHVVAAWDDGVVADCAPGRNPRLKRLTALLEQPLAALDRRPSPSVWHCPLRIAPGDRQLTDAEWADVAAEVLHQTGLAPRGDVAGCRWVAVRHADDHIHLAVTLARQDGCRARTSHDYAKLGIACRVVEERYELTVTPARDRTAPKRPSRAELEKALREGQREVPRQRLRREVLRAALASEDLVTFAAQLGAAGIAVRLRHSQVDPTQVTGYAVASRQDHTVDGELIWFGGARLAPQLSLPRLTSLWAGVTVADRRGHAMAARPAASVSMTGLADLLNSAAIAVGMAEDGNFARSGAALARAALRLARSDRAR